MTDVADIQAKFDSFKTQYNTDLDNTNAKLKDLTERLEELKLQVAAPVEVAPVPVVAPVEVAAEAPVVAPLVAAVGGRRRRKASRKASRKTSRKSSKRR